MNIDVRFSENNQCFKSIFVESNQRFEFNFGQIHTVTEYVGGELYEGEYGVTPKMEEQTLLTKDKVLIEDVTIHAVPVYRVSNTSGGITVYIANEV